MFSGCREFFLRKTSRLFDLLSVVSRPQKFHKQFSRTVRSQPPADWSRTWVSHQNVTRDTSGSCENYNTFRFMYFCFLVTSESCWKRRVFIWLMITMLEYHWPLALSRKGVVSVMPDSLGGMSETALSNYLGSLPWTSQLLLQAWPISHDQIGIFLHFQLCRKTEVDGEKFKISPQQKLDDGMRFLEEEKKLWQFDLIVGTVWCLVWVCERIKTGLKILTNCVRTNYPSWLPNLWPWFRLSCHSFYSLTCGCGPLKRRFSYKGFWAN